MYVEKSVDGQNRLLVRSEVVVRARVRDGKGRAAVVKGCEDWRHTLCLFLRWREIRAQVRLYCHSPFTTERWSVRVKGCSLQAFPFRRVEETGDSGRDEVDRGLAQQA